MKSQGRERFHISSSFFSLPWFQRLCVWFSFSLFGEQPQVCVLSWDSKWCGEPFLHPQTSPLFCCPAQPVTGLSLLPSGCGGQFGPGLTGSVPWRGRQTPWLPLRADGVLPCQSWGSPALVLALKLEALACSPTSPLPSWVTVGLAEGQGAPQETEETVCPQRISGSSHLWASPSAPCPNRPASENPACCLCRGSPLPLPLSHAASSSCSPCSPQRAARSRRVPGKLKCAFLGPTPDPLGRQLWSGARDSVSSQALSILTQAQV